MTLQEQLSALTAGKSLFPDVLIYKAFCYGSADAVGFPEVSFELLLYLCSKQSRGVQVDRPSLLNTKPTCLHYSNDKLKKSKAKCIGFCSLRDWRVSGFVVF